MSNNELNKAAYKNAIRKAYKDINYHKPSKTFSRKRHNHVYSARPTTQESSSGNGSPSLLKSSSASEWDSFKDKIRRIKEIASRVDKQLV